MLLVVAQRGKKLMNLCILELALKTSRLNWLRTSMELMMTTFGPNIINKSRVKKREGSNVRMKTIPI